VTARARRKALPRLAESLRWFKRDVVRQMRRRIADVRSPSLRADMQARLSKLQAMPPAALRQDYLRERAREIESAPLWELTQALAARGVCIHRLAWWRFEPGRGFIRTQVEEVR